MQHQGNTIMAEGGREASRQRRKMIAQGKAALPPKAERTRSARHDAGIGRGSPAPVPISVPPETAAPAPSPAPAAPKMPTGGRAASRARRAAMVRGKAGLGKADAPSATLHSQTRAETGPASARETARAMRAARSNAGRDTDQATRPSGRVREAKALIYPAKVAVTQTQGAQRVTGSRIGRGRNVTGDEPGIDKPISGTQYIATDGAGAYRAQAPKVGAAKTPQGRVVTGTQVRSKVTVTGDEFRAAVAITGEADQTPDDDMTPRDETGYSATAQFHRQNNPHGASVFGSNLGRSIRHVGSRDRGGEDPAVETSLGGHRISGSAIGRSPIVTGDEPGACHPVTGSQYLRAAGAQPLCETPTAPTPALARMGMMPARGETETWARQRITGVEVEFKPGVTGDEPGTCAAITGTPYSGPGPYESVCETAQTDAAAARLEATQSGRPRITGNLPLHAQGVTGTQRGAGNAITGTPYWRQGGEPAATAAGPETVAARFSVSHPQRSAQIAAAGASQITGSFAVGAGMVTGSSEFDHVSRWQGRPVQSAPPVTGEGRTDGARITGSAWEAHGRVTGTEGFTAAGRNPTARAGAPAAFAGAGAFQGRGKAATPGHDVTGMAGTDPAGGEKRSARITLSGGARG